MEYSESRKRLAAKEAAECYKHIKGTFARWKHSIATGVSNPAPVSGKWIKAVPCKLTEKELQDLRNLRQENIDHCHDDSDFDSGSCRDEDNEDVSDPGDPL